MQTAADNIVEPHNYSVVLTYKAKKGTWPAMRGQIFEGDVLVGTFNRPALKDFIPEIGYKFYSEAAKHRFDDFANCLSIPETIEALLPF